MHRPSPTLALIAGGTLTALIVLWQPGFRVVDGDTVDHGYWRWRLAGYDAPETRGSKCAEERALGKRAATRLRSLVAAGGITLRYVSSRDPYRRRLGILEARGKDVATTLIAEGLARPNHGEKRGGWCPPAQNIQARE